MQIGILSYNCKCCSNPVHIPVNKNETEKQIELYTKLFNSKHCLSCHTDKHIPETAEAIKVFLVGK